MEKQSNLVPKSQINKVFNGYFHCTGKCERCTELDCRLRMDTSVWPPVRVRNYEEEAEG